MIKPKIIVRAATGKTGNVAQPRDQRTSATASAQPGLQFDRFERELRRQFQSRP